MRIGANINVFPITTNILVLSEKKLLHASGIYDKLQCGIRVLN